MLRSKNPLETVLNRAGEVARLVAADRLFSWTVRSISPPAGWVAWALRSEQDPAIVQPGGVCEREGVTDVLFVRLAPIDCLIEDAGLQSADGHEFTGRLRLKVRIIPEAAELAAFRRAVLGSSKFLAKADLERYLQWQGRKILAELAGEHKAEELLQGLEGEAVRRLVEGRLGAVCLAGGLATEPAARAEFDSDAYLNHRRRASDLDRQQKEADARSQIQQALSAAQSQRLNHVISMLEQMREASKVHGERTLMDLIQAFNPAERGQMYSAMWRLAPTARRTRFVAAVSGQELLLFDPADLQRPARRHRLPESLGALRSVRMDERARAAGVLLVGAATGVWVVHAETGEPVRRLAMSAAPSVQVRGGFNSAAMSDGWVLGSHSEMGVIAWPRAGEDAAEGRSLLGRWTDGAQTVRCLEVVGERAWVAVNERVVRFNPAETIDSEPVAYVGSNASIGALAVTRDAVYAGTGNGQILHWPMEGLEQMSVFRRATGLPVESINVVDSGGVEWLIVADGQDAITTAVIGDSHACRYEAGTARVRRAAAAEDLFVAMNDNRDRLLAWQPDKPAGPAATVVVPYLTGGSIQDLCLVPA